MADAPDPRRMSRPELVERLTAALVEPLGFYVLVRERGRWAADWDGELHPTREAGEKSLAEARKDGWEAVLTAAVPFPIDTEGTDQ